MFTVISPSRAGPKLWFRLDVECSAEISTGEYICGRVVQASAHDFVPRVKAESYRYSQPPFALPGDFLNRVKQSERPAAHYLMPHVKGARLRTSPGELALSSR
jgi:hypothetical protein